jgi:nucleotide-binding universal stress UspA family protein
MYRSILLPLDGSLFSESAVPLALSLSRRTGAAVRLLSVVEYFPTTDPYGWQDVLRDQAESYLGEMAERIHGKAGGEISTAVLHGHVVTALQTEAETADIVVMATHGRGGLSRAWLGSVADQTVRHAKHPVLLVRPEENGEPDPHRDWTISRMLLPLDGSPVSEAILGHAVELGSLFGAAYHLARIVPSPKQFSSPYPPHMIQANKERLQKEEEEAAEYLHEHAERLRAQGHTVEEKVITGVQPVHGILSEAKGSDCDFIAISAHGRGLLARAVMGSTSDKVVRGSHLPLLLYRAPE